MATDSQPPSIPWHDSSSSGSWGRTNKHERESDRIGSLKPVASPPSPFLLNVRMVIDLLYWVRCCDVCARKRLEHLCTWMENWQAKLNYIHQVCGPILANFPAHHLCHKHTLLYRASMIGLHELCYSFFQQTWPKLVFLGRFGLGFRMSLRKSQEPLGGYISYLWKRNGDPYCRTLQFSSGQPVGGALRLPGVVPSKDSTETRHHGLACDTIL